MSDKTAKKDESMEEILDSIRDIVTSEEPAGGEEDVLDLSTMEAADDGPPPASVATNTVPAAEDIPADANATKEDVLANIDNALQTGAEEVTAAKPAAPAPAAEEKKQEAVAPPPPPPPPAAPAPAAPEVKKPEPAPAAAPAPAPTEKPAAPAPAPAAATPSAAAPIDSALIAETAAKQTTEALKNLVDNIPKPVISSPEMRSGNTVEDLVVEAIKPMLSTWLNENLPTIVKHIVEKEVRKLIPRE